MYNLNSETVQRFSFPYHTREDDVQLMKRFFFFSVCCGVIITGRCVADIGVCVRGIGGPPGAPTMMDVGV